MQTITIAELKQLCEDCQYLNVYKHVSRYGKLVYDAKNDTARDCCYYYNGKYIEFSLVLGECENVKFCAKKPAYADILN